MGRQAYLTKIALGRSAFEPSQTTPTPSSAYVQLEFAQQEIPSAARESNINLYTQLYDERGNPINPRAYEHGRRLREAQNDVLSSIGVVQRRRSPSEDLPGSYGERLEQLENEDSMGNAIMLTSTLAENVCTWWIGSLRDRILTFRFPRALPFSQIVVSEWQNWGAGLVYAGFPSQSLSSLGVQLSVYAAFELRPLDRLLIATHASRRTVSRVRRFKHEISICFRLLVELAFYPLAYHASLQRLGLISAKQLPCWKSFIPFSRWSPIRPSLVYPAISTTSQASTLANAISGLRSAILVPITSPLCFIILGHFMERWIYAVIYEAIESTVIRPENPDLIAPDDGTKLRSTAMHGLRTTSPSMIRTTINSVLVALGWGSSLESEGTGPPPPELVQTSEIEIIQTLEVGGQEVTNVERLRLPVAHSASSSGVNGLSLPFNSSSDIASLLTPPSPTASEASHDDSDPRIRITSREGIVEMEVRLPPHVLAAHTANSGATLGSPERNMASPIPARDPEAPPYHRVTQLSKEPSQMIGAICKSQIVGWAMLPLNIITLRLVAAHYLASNPNYTTSLRRVAPLPNVYNLSLRSIGLLLSRVALCGALEVAIDLALWGLQWTAVTYTGTNYFGWGTL